MTVNVQTLSWQSTSPTSNDRAAVVVADSAIDHSYSINIYGNVSDNDYNVVPKFLTVDNIANTTPVAVSFGPLSYTTPPAQRETFSIPDQLKTCTIGLTTGKVNLTFATTQFASDVANQLLVQQTAVKTLIYGYVTYGANQAQQSSDVNSNVVFNAATAITYSLSNIPTFPVGNGWFQFIKNYGTAPVTILPFGGQTINGGAFTNAKPLILNPGDSGNLSSDGSNWFFQGSLSYESAEIALADNGISTPAHNLGARPDNVIVIMRCKIADLGWLVGDEVIVNPNAYNNAGGVHTGALSYDATSVRFQQNISGGTGNRISLANKTSGADGSLVTAANWRFVIRATVTW